MLLCQSETCCHFYFFHFYFFHFCWLPVRCNESSDNVNYCCLVTKQEPFWCKTTLVLPCFCHLSDCTVTSLQNNYQVSIWVRWRLSTHSNILTSGRFCRLLLCFTWDVWVLSQSLHRYLYPHHGVGKAQLAECLTSQAQYWCRFESLVRQGIFLPVNFKCRLSYGVRTSPVCNRMHQHLGPR